jgi:hypothetical protein
MSWLKDPLIQKRAFHQTPLIQKELVIGNLNQLF